MLHLWYSTYGERDTRKWGPLTCAHFHFRSQIRFLIGAQQKSSKPMKSEVDLTLCPSLIQEKAMTSLQLLDQKKKIDLLIDRLDQSTKGLIEASDQPKLRPNNQLLQDQTSIYITMLPSSYKGRQKECFAHLSYGLLPQHLFTPLASRKRQSFIGKEHVEVK